MGLARSEQQGGHSLLVLRGDNDDEWNLFAYRVP